MNLDKVKGFQGNAFTAFGNAIHDTCEKMLTEGFRRQKIIFSTKIQRNFEELPENVEKKGDLVEKMKTQAPPILDEVLPALESHFGEYKVVSAEEDLMEMIEYFTPKQVEKFKGFIDLIIETQTENIILLTGKLVLGAGMLKKIRSDDDISTYFL